MANVLPPMMQVMKDIGGIELPESLIRFADDPSAPVEQQPTSKVRNSDH